MEEEARDGSVGSEEEEAWDSGGGPEEEEEEEALGGKTCPCQRSRHGMATLIRRRRRCKTAVAATEEGGKAGSQWL